MLRTPEEAGLKRGARQFICQSVERPSGLQYSTLATGFSTHVPQRLKPRPYYRAFVAALSAAPPKFRVPVEDHPRIQTDPLLGRPLLQHNHQNSAVRAVSVAGGIFRALHRIGRE